jgi:2-polyprenyl-3-methyl-5-hydroxy-6-metoxy-1,4-benzoquinol methylase
MVHVARVRQDKQRLAAQQMNRERRVIETFGFRKRLEHFRHLLTLESNSLGRQLHVVDVGCGTGLEVTDPLARDGHEVVGLDIDLPSVQRGCIARYVCGDTRALRSAAFDVAICSEVLEHLRSPLDLLIDIRRVLRPSGLCLVTVPNGFGPYEASERVGKVVSELLQRAGCEPLRHEARPTRGAVETLNYASRHIGFFRFRHIRDLFRTAGFDEMEYRGRTLLCGALLSEAIGVHEFLVRANEWAADVVPAQLVSDWMFALRVSA